MTRPGPLALLALALASVALATRIDPVAPTGPVPPPAPPPPLAAPVLPDRAPGFDPGPVARLFGPDPAPAEPGVELATLGAVSATDPPRLVGVLIRAGQREALIDPGDGSPPRWLREGEPLGNAVILAISQQGVRLSGQGPALPLRQPGTVQVPGFPAD